MDNPNWPSKRRLKNNNNKFHPFWGRQKALDNLGL
jgi:hypothetical protein